MHLNESKIHRDMQLFVGLFLVMTTLYSALDLSGFFIADFFKNNVVHLLGIHTNDQMTKFHLVVYGFFVFKLLSSIGMISTINTTKKIIYGIFTFIIIGIEGILQIGVSCGLYDPDHTTTGCSSSFAVHPYATLIVTIAMLVILIPLFYKQFKLIK